MNAQPRRSCRIWMNIVAVFSICHHQRVPYLPAERQTRCRARSDPDQVTKLVKYAVRASEKLHLVVGCCGCFRHVNRSFSVRRVLNMACYIYVTTVPVTDECPLHLHCDTCTLEFTASCSEVTGDVSTRDPAVMASLQPPCETSASSGVACQ